MEAEAAAAAFKTKVQAEGKELVEFTFKDQTWKEYEGRDSEMVVQQAYDAMVDRYPRMTGDRTQPYLDKEHKVAIEGVQMLLRAK